MQTFFRNNYVSDDADEETGDDIYAIIINELHVYEKMNYKTAMNTNPPLLTWWRSAQFTIPYLFELAMGILAIPASSTSAEQHFSTAGLVDTKRRSRLSPAKFKSIMISKQSRNFNCSTENYCGKYFFRKSNLKTLFYNRY